MSADSTPTPAPVTHPSTPPAARLEINATRVIAGFAVSLLVTVLSAGTASLWSKVSALESARASDAVSIARLETQIGTMKETLARMEGKIDKLSGKP